MTRPDRGRAVVGLCLAGAIVGGWIFLHVWGVFLHRVDRLDWLRAPLVIAVQSWLGAGMFIVAHDAIHGSLAPGRPRLNGLVGQLCVGLYAGFAFGKLARSHAQHHRAPGTPADPDFHASRPTAFAPWFVAFFRRYFGWGEFLRISAVLGLYLLVLRTQPLNIALFWGLPAILSALQLFTFGTFLPHRHGGGAFADRHQARTLDYPWLLSLAACFHFGRHREHHLRPDVPWWRLPGVRLEG